MSCLCLFLLGVAALGPGCGREDCLDEGRGTNVVVVDARTGAGVCAVLFFLDGGDEIARIDASDKNTDGSCTGSAWLFDSAEPGTYTLKILAYGYQPFEREVELVAFGGCEMPEAIEIDGVAPPVSGDYTLRLLPL